MRQLFNRLLLAVLGLLCQCGQGFDDLVVNVQGRWPEIQALEVNATLNGMPATSGMTIRSQLDAFTIRLPEGSMGNLQVNVTGLESDQCKGGTGQASVMIQPGIAPGPVMVALSRMPMKMCNLEVVADRGAGQLASSPEGLHCEGVRCTGDFPVMTQVQLYAPPGSRSYVYWSGECAGTGDCTVTMDRKKQVGTSYLPRSCTKDDWCRHNPLPDGAAPRGVWARDGDDIWTVGGGGSILHFDGKIWAPVESGTKAYLSGIWGSGGGDIWIVGAGGTILGSQDGGRSWSGIASGVTETLTAIWGSEARDVWAVGSNGTLLHFDGQQWQKDPKSGSLPDLKSIWGSLRNNIWAVGSSGVLVHYDGTGWAEVAESRKLVPFPAPYNFAQDDLHSVWGSGPGDVWVVGWAVYYDSVAGQNIVDGAILHFDGTQWTRVGAGAQWFGTNWVWGTGPSDVWVRRGWTQRTINGGKDWASIGDGLASTLLWARNATDLWALGAGTQLHSTDDGKNWTTYSRNTTYSRYGLDHLEGGIWGSGKSNIWVGARNAGLIKFDGRQWAVDSQASALSGGGVSDVWGSDDKNVWAVTTNSKILFFDGTAWRIQFQPKDVVLRSVWGSGAGDVWAVGDAGVIYHYNGSWAVDPQSKLVTAKDLYKVWGTGPDEAWAVGKDGVILHYIGSRWRADPQNEKITTKTLKGVWGSSSSDIWVVGSEGILLHYNGSWTIDSQSGLVPGFLWNIWGRGRTDVWAVGEDVLHYDGTWKKIDAGASYLRGAWGSDAKDVWAVGDDGAIVHYQP